MGVFYYNTLMHLMQVKTSKDETGYYNSCYVTCEEKVLNKLFLRYRN